MDLEDALTIVTPEGVELRVVLAGAASRAIALAFDLCFQLLLLLLAALVALVLIGGAFGVAIFIVAAFAIFFGYWIAFEVLAGGRTPGMRFTHLRVVRAGGAPVDLPASAIRTLLRLIDSQPGFTYLVAAISVLLSKNNQRLGDLAAGTLVLREVGTLDGGAAQRVGSGAPGTTTTAGTVVGTAFTGTAAEPAAAWDVSAVTVEEMAAVERFLARRGELAPASRVSLAARLEAGLRAKVSGAPPTSSPEVFLESLARIKSGR